MRPTLAARVRARLTRRRRRAAEHEPAAGPTRAPAGAGLAGLYGRRLLPDPTRPAPLGQGGDPAAAPPPLVGRRELWEDLWP